MWTRPTSEWPREGVRERSVGGVRDGWRICWAGQEQRFVVALVGEVYARQIAARCWVIQSSSVRW